MRNEKIIIYLIIICFIFSACESSEVIKERKEQWRLVKENVFTFDDGQYVDLWGNYMPGREIYRLANGETLLVVKESRESIGLDLSENAQQVINEYYEKQGILYDVNTELEKAYSYYLKCKENNEVFTSSQIGQEAYTTGSNDKIVCILTLVRIPLRELGVFNSLEKLNTIFNKDTGEIYDVWDLFYYSKEETIERLIKAAEITDENLMREISDSIKVEYIGLESESLVIDFPRGAISSEDDFYSMYIPYEKLEGLIRDWAIPHKEEIPVY